MIISTTKNCKNTRKISFMIDFNFKMQLYSLDSYEKYSALWNRIKSK